MHDFDQIKKQFTNYFENVLGIKHVLLVEKDYGIINSKPFIFIQNFSKYSVAEIELTKKILGAVGLQIENVTVVEESSVNCILQFSDQPENEIQIFSPRTLLQKPELKKVAWDQLKRK